VIEITSLGLGYAAGGGLRRKRLPFERVREVIRILQDLIATYGLEDQVTWRDPSVRSTAPKG